MILALIAAWFRGRGDVEIGGRRYAWDEASGRGYAVHRRVR